MTSARVKELENHLVSLELFMQSPAHVGFISARKTEINMIKDRILNSPPIDQANIANSLMAFGELECQMEMIKTFEDARVSLKAKIDEQIELDNQNATDTKP